ncbi:MAG: peptidoglycan DD-metalloendopeptidase family protein [Bacteroidia bacterium]|jgi:septal ring factor EnvC (AmiA/AmiB activator)|nr:peptidoglycan DD-metalloendopeptidase family protein [Bacteroidia bacterium]
MPYKFKRNRCIVLLALLVSFSIILPPSTFAQSKNSKKELENRKKRINEEINQINSMLKATKASKKNSLGTLMTINVKLEKRQELINTINAEIRVLNKDILANESESEKLKKSLDKLKKEYARMILVAQRNQDAYSSLMFIFAADDFNQAYARLKYLQQYSGFRKKQAAEIIQTQNELEVKINTLKLQRDEKNELLKNEQSEKKNLDKERNEQEGVLTELKKKEKELKASLEKKKQNSIELQLAIKRMMAEEIKRKADEAARELAAKAKKEKEEEERLKPKKGSGSTPPPPKEPVKTNVSDSKPVLNNEALALGSEFSGNRGRLPWPVDKGVICETYGEHEHPAIKGFMMFNSGVEICTAKGAQARAVFEGEVTGIAISPTGGKLVIIRHGEYLSVYSNIGEVFVKTGQKVKVKEVIGTVMYDEEEDKTSMNLQIWKGQKTMDPSAWLSNAR